MIYNVCPRSGLETCSPPPVEPTKTMPNGRRVVQTITRWRTRSRKQPNHSIRRPLHTVSTNQAPDVVLESPAVLSGSNSLSSPFVAQLYNRWLAERNLSKSADATSTPREESTAESPAPGMYQIESTCSPRRSRSCQLVESAYRDLHCVTQLLRMRRVPRQFLVCEVDRQEEALDASEVSRQLHLSRPRIRWVREESAPGVSACLQKV